MPGQPATSQPMRAHIVASTAEHPRPSKADKPENHYPAPSQRRQTGEMSNVTTQRDHGGGGFAGRLLAGVAGAALLMTVNLPAAAQDEPTSQVPPTPAPTQQQPTPQARSSIETVMVSARKTEERAIDTPVALSVLTETQMQRYNTTDVTQLTAQLPGVE